MKIINLFYIAFLIPFICSQPVYAQLKNGLRAPSSVPNSQYPYIHSDGKVTFRIFAPSAKRVQVVGRDNKIPFGEKPTDLIRGEDGVWVVKIPINPGFHYYQLIIDGTPVNDPASKTYSTLQVHEVQGKQGERGEQGKQGEKCIGLGGGLNVPHIDEICCISVGDKLLAA